MSKKLEIAIIFVGHRISPFIETLIEKEDIAYFIATNNSADFNIHHADPSKALNYNLEFTNVIELKSRKAIDSVLTFETLGQFFDFYNPLRLSTINYLISRYATTIKPEHKKYLAAWKQITTSLFDEEDILPLFEEIRVLHIKEDNLEVPVRQYILLKDIEARKNGKEKNNKNKEAQTDSLTGIIDLKEISRMKLCNETVRKIETAAAVIIVPTDIISLFILFNSNNFKNTLKKTSGKITILSPLWPGESMSKIEKLILTKTDFTPDLLHIAELIKDYVDIILIDKSNSELVPNLRETGITVLVDDLSEPAQKSREFLEVVLKSTGVSIDSITVEPKEKKEGFVEKLVNLVSLRSIRKEEHKEIMEETNTDIESITHSEPTKLPEEPVKEDSTASLEPVELTQEEPLTNASETVIETKEIEETPIKQQEPLKTVNYEQDEKMVIEPKQNMEETNT
ncbi:MAG: hypothetical protein ACFFBD_25370, partial [Candidatus Hodarchaeota archaeon]